MACKVFELPDEARQEAELLMAVAHPNIVRCFGVNESKFLLMEFLEGPNLKHLLYSQPSERLAVSDALRLTIYIGAALTHIHEIGLLHLDVKPSNVILVNGRPILFDFGAARGQTAARPRKVKGTDPYIAPEECLLEVATPAADVFSLGVTLYELLTGNLPFPGRTKGEPFPQVEKSPTPIRHHRPAIPADLEKLILSCLRRDPSIRPNLVALLPCIARLYPRWPANVAGGFSAC